MSAFWVAREICEGRSVKRHKSASRYVLRRFPAQPKRQTYSTCCKTRQFYLSAIGAMMKRLRSAMRYGDRSGANRRRFLLLLLSVGQGPAAIRLIQHLTLY